ncbi:MAG: hypothetical protein D6709_07720 [Chloroflexi bacterium]|jgi:hypothetical protein|uniref:Uncharacterized protein n=1 Tax=Candidatus Thermofonsia Clade 3 bacterium TaxID=2364212 RepID=A0A2M8Q9R2_9CHLR|nr:MAG: hypothetical protein CUN48_13235 [Candidatus Thermofonsia Clade 3 bacterium]RMG63651.1 MAG: hypothetical protein D6709_07720 [Chloroflexota bacterium]
MICDVWRTHLSISAASAPSSGGLSSGHARLPLLFAQRRREGFAEALAHVESARMVAIREMIV